MKRRSGYTLLEVMLAIAIGLLLIAALYVALDVQMRYMQAGRNAVVEGQLARGVLSRMARDIRAHLGKLPAEAAAAASTATSAAPASNADQSGSAAGDALGTAQFNYGIQGDETQLILFVSGVPRYGSLDADSQNGVSDLRRIVYALQPGTGLVRIESRLFSTAPEDMADAEPEVLAAEVIDLQFQYYDGSSGTWLPSWEGTTSGPPLAVEITLWLQPPVDLIMPRTEAPPPSYYRMVVAIPSAVIPTDASSTTTTP